KPDGFTSLCLSSNLVVWTSTKGSRIVSLGSVADESEWTPTSGGINGSSSDGQWLGIHHPFTAVLDVYRLPGLEPVTKLTHRTSIGTFKFSPAGDELAIISSRHIGFWSSSTWKRTRELTNFMSLLYTPDARALWLAKDFRTAGLYDAHTLKLLLPLPTGMLPLALSPDGRR